MAESYRARRSESRADLFAAEVAAMRAFAGDLAGSSQGKHIAIEGKTLRHSFDRASAQAPVHMVGAWA